MDNNFLKDLSSLQGDGIDVLRRLFKLSELVLDQQFKICHVSSAFKEVLSSESKRLVSHALSDFIDTTDYEYLVSLLAQQHDQPISVKLSFLNGQNKNDVFELTFEQIASQGHRWLLLKNYHQVKESTGEGDFLFEHNALAQLIVEPITLSIIASNKAAHQLLPNSGLSQSQAALGNVINLPYVPLMGLFDDVTSESDNVLSVPLFITEDNEHSNILINRMDYQGRQVWLLQFLNNNNEDSTAKHATSLELTDALFDAKNYALLMMDSFGVINQINQWMCDLLQLNRNEVIGQRAKAILPHKISTLISTSEDSQHTVSLPNTSLSYTLKQQPLRNHKGYVLGLLLELSAAEDKEQGLISRAYEAVNNAGNHAIFITDKSGFIVYVNAMFEHQTGYLKESIVGQNFSILKNEDSNDEIAKNLWKTINGKDTWRGVLKHQRQSGATYWSDLTLKPLLDRDNEIECFVGLSNDITLQKEMQKSGTYLANYDVTTGLANSILAKDRLEGMMGRARRRKLIVAVIYLDIMQINDIAKQYDEETANSILLIYCNNLQHALRAEDAMARMSKDRLAILLPDLPNGEALDVVSAKVDRVNQESIIVGERSFRFDIRQGVSYYPDQGLDCESLLKNAEASIIKAWSTGSPIGCFSKGQNDNALMHFQMRREIEDMIINNGFDVKYQPIINLSDDSLHSVEAQIVWHHKVYGSIHNDDVYAVAEASGCVQELGLLLLEKVCIDANHWQKMGIDNVNVSINLSHGQLRSKRVPDKFSKILQRYKIDNQRLSLEIPLSYIATQWLNLDDILQQFSLLGFSLQYDKFGDRGAYISDLRNFPFSGIKLTQDYVSSIDEDVSTANLVEGIISMASSLNLDVTAVGVTEFSQVLQLQEMGCKRAQGDFLSKFTDRKGIAKFIQQGITI